MFVNYIAIKSRRNISSLVSSSIRRKLSSCKLESQLKYFSTAATHEFEDDVDTDPVKLDCNKTSWQAEHNMDIQRVTQKAIVSICFSCCQCRISSTHHLNNFVVV